MNLLFLSQTLASTGGPAAGQAPRGTAAQPHGFAALLSLLQAGRAMPSPALSATATRFQDITFPGNADARAKAATGLLTRLNQLAGRTMAALGDIESRSLGEDAADGILAEAAVQLREMLRAFDAATGADSLATLTANLARLPDTPQFAAAAAGQGKESAESSTQTGTEPPATARATAMFALATELLGLAKTAPVAAASLAQRPALPEPGARPAMAPAPGSQRAALPTAPGLPAQAAPHPVAAAPAEVQPRDIQSRSELPQAAGDEGRGLSSAAPAASAASENRAWAKDMLGMAVQAKPGVPAEATQQAPAPLPQAGVEPRLPGAVETTAAPRTAATPPQTPAPPDGFARNLANQIRSSSFSEGRTRIELSPRGLGSIEIDLQADEAGKLRVVLRAENPAVLNALRGDRASLLAVLGDNGVAVEDSALDFEAFGQQRQGQGDAPPATSRPASPAEEEAESAAPTRRDPRPLPGTGRLDIMT
ncbi:MAG: flagellar hook-length control protein FliK [Paracoccaceae bacterium]